jgi:molecular chaperone HtpG
MTMATAQTHGFQAEAKQLLHLMTHSLYSNKEVFLRELVSNASDAVDKLRYLALSDASLYENNAELNITIELDGEANTFTITDNGIGMSREEVIEHLGTIAKSGTAKFFASLGQDEKQTSELIGQFGVGFYASFIVAKKVEVLSRRAGASAEEGVRWVSTGDAEFTVEPINKATRGTTVILHLKDEDKEFCDNYRVRNTIKKYADHISLPILMKKISESADSEQSSEYETINTATALWTRNRNDIKADEYNSFYQHISHDYVEPLTWSHNRVEGKLDYTSLLFIPSHAPFDLWNRESSRGLKLYVRRVFIMDQAEQFLPLYLRFIKGVIDSNDLSLNVSREILQKDAVVDSMRAALTKRTLEMLEKLSESDALKYQTCWNQFGQVLKEGLAEDFGNKEKIAALLRFSTTFNDSAEQNQSLANYVSRMTPEQNTIYYVIADTFNAAKNSPHLEIFRKKGVEVLLLNDRIDEWMMSYLFEFEGKSLQNIAKGELDEKLFVDEAQQQARDELAHDQQSFVERMKEALKDKVAEVRASYRLTESPACLVVGNDELGMPMRRMMQAAGQKIPESKPALEFNPQHPLIARLNHEQDVERFNEFAMVLFDQAHLAEGGQLEDPAAYVHRLNKLLLNVIQ